MTHWTHALAVALSATHRVPAHRMDYLRERMRALAVILVWLDGAHAAGEERTVTLATSGREHHAQACSHPASREYPRLLLLTPAHDTAGESLADLAGMLESRLGRLPGTLIPFLCEHGSPADTCRQCHNV